MQTKIIKITILTGDEVTNAIVKHFNLDYPSKVEFEGHADNGILKLGRVTLTSATEEMDGEKI